MSALLFRLALIASSLLSGKEQLINPSDTERWTPVPPIVRTDRDARPSDAILLSGNNWRALWHTKGGGAPRWKYKRGVISVAPGTGDIETTEAFGDIQLHVEWRIPGHADARSGAAITGNSGVYLMGLYEVQVYNSYGSPLYVNGQAGSIYKQYAPLVNVCRPPGEWQSYDIVFKAPQFSAAGTLVSPATATVLQNGVLIQSNVTIEGATVYRGKAEYRPHPSELPLRLQEHNDVVDFRNIWVRRLK